MKPKRKKSQVWKFFTKDGVSRQVRCSFCLKDLKFVGNTTNLRKHLAALHQVEFDTENQDESVVATSLLELDYISKSMNGEEEIDVQADHLYSNTEHEVRIKPEIEVIKKSSKRNRKELMPPVETVRKSFEKDPDLMFCEGLYVHFAGKDFEYKKKLRLKLLECIIDHENNE